jgi:hypothetical protein
MRATTAPMTIAPALTPMPAHPPSDSPREDVFGAGVFGEDVFDEGVFGVEDAVVLSVPLQYSV